MANGAIIGGPTFSYYRTWASLRTVFAKPYQTEIEDYSITYYSSIYPPNPPLNVESVKSAASGSGLIRADINNIGYYLNIFDIGGTNNRPDPANPGHTITDFYMILAWWEYGTVNQTLVPVEVQNQLIGETVVTSTGVTFNITSDLFSPPDGKQFFLYGASASPGFVISVGKLTPIT